MNRSAALGLAILAVLVPTAEAKVVAKSPTGFLVEHSVELKTDAKTARDAFVGIGAWWDGSHSYSGDGKNMSIELKPGGCWCEALPDGGFVEHMSVINTAPGMLVFSGGLGPLQFIGVAGSMTVNFKATNGKTTVTLRYDVGGRDDKDFDEISKGVDAVLGEQFTRYTSFVTTGKVDSQ